MSQILFGEELNLGLQILFYNKVTLMVATSFRSSDAAVTARKDAVFAADWPASAKVAI
jgi:hypothetical protein